MKEDIGKRIKNIRESMGMTKESFAKQIGISGQYLGLIEHGKNNLSIEKLKVLCDFTNLSADYILFGNIEDNDDISKINHILCKCSDDTLKYVYELIHSSFTFLKKYDKDL